MRIAHVSDLHFGRIAFPEIIDVLLRDIHDAGVSLVAVSGDLTQRALPRQFRLARDMLARFRVPVIVVPGNHDVYPWWRPLSRLFRPLHRYDRFFGVDHLDRFQSDDVAVLGINSAHGRTIKGGRIRRRIVEQVEAFFGACPPNLFKILVLHHHLVELEGLVPHDTAHRGQSLFDTACRVGIHLVLCGHVHVSHVESLPCASGRGIVIASAGTATSSRGRRSNRGLNYYNLIDVEPAYFTIEERCYDPEQGAFRSARLTRFER